MPWVQLVVKPCFVWIAEIVAPRSEHLCKEPVEVGSLQRWPALRTVIGPNNKPEKAPSKDVMVDPTWKAPVDPVHLDKYRAMKLEFMIERFGHLV